MIVREWLLEALARGVSEIGAEVKHQVAFGSHELAATLFNGSAFVMYPRGTREDHISVPEQAQIQEPGREM
jgi:hypothetical protein